MLNLIQKEYFPIKYVHTCTEEKYGIIEYIMVPLMMLFKILVTKMSRGG